MVMLYVITGPPAAGKTTWVRQHAQPGDVVIDYDQIAAALTIPGTTQSPGSSLQAKALRDVAYRARRAAVDEALKHSSTVDVYIIHTLPAADARTRYQDHDAHVVVVDPGKAVVLERIRQQRSTTMLPVAMRWYASTNHDSHTVCSHPQQSRSW